MTIPGTQPILRKRFAGKTASHHGFGSQLWRRVVKTGGISMDQFSANQETSYPR